MKKLYLLLDNELKMCIAVDRCVVLYKEYDYTESILDQLYSKISAHNVDAAIVVTKGILSEQFFGESYKVFNFSIKDSKHSCYVSKFDVNKIVNLLNTSGVDDVRVLDKFGYYVSLNKHDCCMIDTLGNAYSVITFKDKIRDISYNSYQNLEKILINCNKKFAVDDFVDMTMYYDERYLKYFKNVDKIQEKLEKAVEDEDANSIKDLVMVLATLSTFAYTELKIAHYFELSPDKLTLVNANPIRSEDDYENDEYEYEDVSTSQCELLDGNDDLAKDTSPEESEDESRALAQNISPEGDLAQEDLKEAKKRKKKSKKEKKEKKPAGKALKVANALGVVLSVGMLSATVYSSRAVTSYTQQIGTLSTQNEEILDQIDTANTTLSDYQGFTNNLSTANTYAEMYSTLTKSSYGNDIKTVYYEDGVMKAEVYVKDTTKAKDNKDKTKDKKKKENKVDSKDTITKRIKKDLAKSFEVQQLTEEKSDRDGYLLYAVNLAKK